MSARTSKQIAYWILLMLFSKMAFAIAQPLSTSAMPSTHEHQTQQHQTQQHPIVSSSIKSHCESNDAHGVAQHSAANMTHCDTKCDCCTGHCNAPALLPVVFNNSEKLPQHVRSHSLPTQVLTLSSPLYRPPIQA